MTLLEFWFLFQAVYFLYGTVKCFLMPEKVVKQYSLYQKQGISPHTYEFVSALATFQFGYFVLSMLSYHNAWISLSTLITLMSYYFTLFLKDIYDIYTVGYESNRGRYIGLAIRILFGSITLVGIYGLY